LLIVNRTELTDLGPTASTHWTELWVLKSTRLVELSLRLTDMNNLLLAGPVLPGLADDGGVLAAPLHGAELVGWLATTLELSSRLAACRAELLVRLSTMLTLLATMLCPMLASVLSSMLSRVELSYLLN